MHTHQMHAYACICIICILMYAYARCGYLGSCLEAERAARMDWPGWGGLAREDWPGTGPGRGGYIC